MIPLVFFLTVTTYAVNLEERFYADYNQINKVYSTVILESGSYVAKKSSICTKNELDTRPDCNRTGCNCVSISVSNSPPPAIIGCDMLIPYYKLKANSFQSNQIENVNGEIWEHSTNQQDNLQTASNNVRDWIIDSYNVEHFCQELKTTRRIRRSLWDEFLKTTKRYDKKLANDHPSF